MGRAGSPAVLRGRVGLARAATLTGPGRPATLADHLLPSSLAGGLARWADLALVAAGLALVAALAQVTVPWYPVPFTGQTFGVLLAGGLLGWRRGALAMALYAALAALGLPLMAGGRGGWAAISSPTGGYVFGADRRLVTLVGALLLGEAAIYAVGVSWLALSTVAPGAGPLGFDGAYRLGLEPFVLGDMVKLAAVAVLLPAGWRVLASRRGDPERDRPRLL